MPDTTTPDTQLRRVVGVPFQPGRQKTGGRKPGVPNKHTRNARDLAARLGADPLEFMLEVMNRDAIQVIVVNRTTGQPELDANGQPVKVWQAVPMEMRMDAAKAVAPYLHPKLVGSPSSGKDDRAIEISAIDVNAMMQDPALVEAAQRLSLAANSAPALPAPDHEDPLELPEGSEDY